MTRTTPVENEATGVEHVDVDYEGRTYRFPADVEDADGDVLDAIDDQKLSRALRGLLSAADWAAFKSTRPKVRDYTALFNVYAERVGLGSAGE